LYSTTFVIVEGSKEEIERSTFDPFSLEFKAFVTEVHHLTSLSACFHSKYVKCHILYFRFKKLAYLNYRVITRFLGRTHKAYIPTAQKDFYVVNFILR
jgi:hypothetical protein